MITASPTIATTANPTTGAPTAAPLQDSATLSGTSNLTGPGTVTFYLFAPGVTCATDGTGYTYHEVVTGINGNGPCRPRRATARRWWPAPTSWVAVFSGDANNNAAHSGCSAEPVVITGQPDHRAPRPTRQRARRPAPRCRTAATLTGDEQPPGLGTVTFYLFAPGVTCATARHGLHLSRGGHLHQRQRRRSTSTGYGPPLVAGTYQLGRRLQR